MLFSCPHEHKVPIYIKSQSAWVCQDGTVYSRCTVFILVPQCTHYTEAQKEHRFTEGNPINITASDGDVEKVLLSSHTHVQLSV